MVFFHNPDEVNGYLSNWYISYFNVQGMRFSSMEQYMMYSKAMLFKDTEIAARIITTRNVREIKALGRQVRNFSEGTWISERENIILKGLYAKFTQNKDLGLKLINTGNEILAECAVKDKIWGIGLSMKDERRFNVDQWRGMNLLGKCLMIIRSNIR